MKTRKRFRKRRFARSLVPAPVVITLPHPVVQEADIQLLRPMILLQGLVVGEDVQSEQDLARRALSLVESRVDDLAAFVVELGAITYHLRIVAMAAVLMDDKCLSQSSQANSVAARKWQMEHPITQMLAHKLRNMTCPKSEHNYQAAWTMTNRLAGV